MHFPILIQDLAVILAVAALITYVFYRIHQPVVLGYIVAGMIIGPYTPPFSFVSDVRGIRIWAELGVIFLMFALGLEFSFRKLLGAGAKMLAIGSIQITTMIALGYLLGVILDWSAFDKLFLGCMVAISSTTIIIKALQEQNKTSENFVKIVVGVLVVEDLVAILILAALSGIAVRGHMDLWDICKIFGKLIVISAVWIGLGYLIIPRLVRAVGRLGNDEMLTILALGLCLSMVSLAANLGYSAAFGAFIAGSILAETKEVHRIESSLRSLRDVFAAVFFVSIGMLVNPALILRNWAAILAIVLLVLVGKIASLFISSRMVGLSVKESIQIGFTMAQIGEFSFIIAALGESFNVTSPKLYPSIVAVSVITSFITPYLIRFSTAIKRS